MMLHRTLLTSIAALIALVLAAAPLVSAAADPKEPRRAEVDVDDVTEDDEEKDVDDLDEPDAEQDVDDVTEDDEEKDVDEVTE
jgi:hypothetical protein